MSDLEEIVCYSCAVVFGMTKAQKANRLNDRGTFYCPNGHGQAYGKPTTDPKEAELKQLRADLTKANESVANLQKQVEALKIELDVWRPASAVENGAGMPGEKLLNP